MNQFVTFLSILLYSALSYGSSLESSLSNKSTRITVGMDAPTFTILQVNDRTFTLDEKPTVIWFMTHWCDYMTSQYPQMVRDCEGAVQKLNSAYSQYQDKFQWIGISFASIATKGNIGTYRAENNIQFALGIDAKREIWASYGVRYAPTVIIVDRGKVIYREQASLDKLEDVLAELAN